STMPSPSRVRRASRAAMRLTPNCSDSAASLPRNWPATISLFKTAARICATMPPESVSLGTAVQVRVDGETFLTKPESFACRGEMDRDVGTPHYRLPCVAGPAAQVFRERPPAARADKYDI